MRTEIDLNESEIDQNESVKRILAASILCSVKIIAMHKTPSYLPKIIFENSKLIRLATGITFLNQRMRETNWESFNPTISQEGQPISST